MSDDDVAVAEPPKAINVFEILRSAVTMPPSEVAREIVLEDGGIVKLIVRNDVFVLKGHQIQIKRAFLNLSGSPYSGSARP